MAQSGSTFDRYDLGSGTADNVREDLSDVISNISPTEVPFTSNAGKGKSSNTYKEWLIDTLAAATDNVHIDGDEFAGNALGNADRVGNYHQISRKDLVVSRRANIVNKAGRKSEMAYQIAKAGKELKRDVELAATKRKVGAAGSASAGSESAGIPAWMRTNISRGANGTAPALSGTTTGYPNAVGTAGTARGLTESGILKECRKAYDKGGILICLCCPQL